MTNSISDSFAHRRQRLANIRSSLPPTVRLIAVTKRVSTELMREAYTAGIRDFAESRIQEAVITHNIIIILLPSLLTP